MNYEKINMGSYNLHIIKTKKFKTVSVSVNFRRPVVKDEITIRKLLFSTLCYSSKKYNKNRLLIEKQENLYSLNLVNNLQIYGNYANSCIDIRFLNSDYSEEEILDKSLNFLFEILFNPNIKNEKFDEESLNNVKNELKTAILSIKDNMSLYGLIRVLEEMDPNSPVSYRSWGYLEDIDKISTNDLYEYYKNVLNSDLIDVFIIGDVDNKYITDKFKECFIINTLKRKKIDVFVSYSTYRKRVKKILEKEENLSQAKLSMALKLLNITDYERRYVLPIYTDILGGGSFSRIFQDVREKNSLAYYAFAASKSPSSIILISAGINRENFEKTQKIIRKNIKNMTLKISDEELDRSKANFITNIKSFFNNPTNIISFYLAKEILNADDIDERIKKIKNVTKEEIIKFGSKVKLDTILLLYGEENEEDRD
jgi:predicted Zn-dependent peptidase